MPPLCEAAASLRSSWQARPAGASLQSPWSPLQGWAWADQCPRWLPGLLHCLTCPPAQWPPASGQDWGSAAAGPQQAPPGLCSPHSAGQAIRGCRHCRTACSAGLAVPSCSVRSPAQQSNIRQGPCRCDCTWHEQQPAGLAPRREPHSRDQAAPQAAPVQQLVQCRQLAQAGAAGAGRAPLLVWVRPAQGLWPRPCCASGTASALAASGCCAAHCVT